MAEAFAKIFFDKKIEAYSAGSKPSRKINPKAVEAMKEFDYDLLQQHSKSLDEIKRLAPFDVVVTMGCGDACPWMPATKFLDWNIPDPKEMNASDFKKVRNTIKTRVEELVSAL